MDTKDFEDIFFSNINKRIGIDVRSLMVSEDKNNIKMLKNNVEAYQKVNTNTNRGGEKGRKGFDFEYLDENERKNRYIEEGKNRKVEVLDNNDQITDIKDGRIKYQLKNVNNLNSIDFDKYIDGKARIVVPKDKYELFQKQLDDKILRATTEEDKKRLKKYKKKLESSNISTFDADNPNLYLTQESIKTTSLATMNQYSDKMKNMVVMHLVKIFIEKIKQIRNSESKNFLEISKEILEETILFIKDIWAKELGKSFVDVVLQLAKEKILSFFKKGRDLVVSLLNSLEEVIGLLKKLLLGEISLVEFIQLGLRTVVYTLVATLGIFLEEIIAEFIGIPIIGDIIAIVISVGLVSLATVIYDKYIESILFGFFKVSESKKKLILETKKTDEVKKLLANELPSIIDNREQFHKEFQIKLKTLEKNTENSFKKLNDDTLSLNEFEDEMAKMGDLLGIKI